MAKKPQSVEPAVVRHYTDLLTSLNIQFYEQQINMNNSIDDALKAAESKRGGSGDNRPDIKLLLENTHARRIPVMIEAKGLFGQLEKINSAGEIELVTIWESDGIISKKTGLPTHLAGEVNYTAITSYAVNGAIHYANAILDAKDYTEVIAIGINGFDQENGKAKNLECKAYYISEKNRRVPKLICDITADNWDLLKKENADMLYQLLDKLNLTQEELEQLLSRAESDLDAKILKIHQRIYEDKAITLNTADKMYLFCGLIMAGLSADGLEELKVSSLQSSSAAKQSDGAKILTQIEAYLDCKKCPEDKKGLILAILSPVFTHEDLWRPINGESILKSIFKQVKTDIIPCLESPLHLDFMGRIFNRLGDWIPIASDKKNDVVLTPRYVARLMAKLCRVNMKSRVWDRTMGSGGFLVTAMDLMISDAQVRIHDKAKLEDRIESIKKKQLFGIEVLPEIFILAVLNMILMGDGSSHMVRGDGHNKSIGSDFQADVFLLNPPYSAEGKGFIFVEEALPMMADGYAAVLIQENAGAGMGLPYTKRILENNTLIASIHMPDVFRGKSSVQTAIYLFQIGVPHNPKHLVKFIDFSNDGYARQNRRRSSQDVNLRNVDDAIGRYLEIENIILGQQRDTSYYTRENGLFIEDVITLNGDDWTFAQHKKLDLMPTEADFRKTAADYFAWQASSIIRHVLSCKTAINEEWDVLKFGVFRIGDLFEPLKVGYVGEGKKIGSATKMPDAEHTVPLTCAKMGDNGIMYWGKPGDFITYSNVISVIRDGAISTGKIYAQEDETGVYSHSYMIKVKNASVSHFANLYLACCLEKIIYPKFSRENTCIWERIENLPIQLPVTATGEPDFDYMEKYIRAIEELTIARVYADKGLLIKKT